MTDAPRKESPQAAQAFADFVAMGPSRSLEGLYRLYRARHKSGTHPAPTQRLRTIKEWSTKNHWRDRIAEAVTARTMETLGKANELDSATFLRTSEVLNERMGWTDAGHLDAVVKIRESVRSKSASAGVNVTVNVAIMQEAERLAAELGITVNELLDTAREVAVGSGVQGEANAIAANAWSKAE